MVTIGVGTDGTDTAGQALEWAIDLATRYQGRLVIMSAYKPVDELRLKREQEDAPADYQWTINPTEDVDALLAEAAERAQARKLETITVASQGEPADVLCKLAEEHGVDILVIGNKGMQRRVLGSVPNTVSHKAPCSVFIIKTT